jgi:hypothetical protein
MRSWLTVTKGMVLLVVWAMAGTGAEAIQHAFVATDESGQQVLRVDPAHPFRNWRVPLQARDLQLVGNERLLVSVLSGYRELSLADGTVVRQVDGFDRIFTARRTAAGHTFLGGYGGTTAIQIIELGPDDKPLATIAVDPLVTNIRLMRLTPTGTFLLGSGKDLCEVDRAGQIVRKQTLPDANHIYKAVRLTDGHTLAASGYGAFLAEIAPDGTVVRTLGKSENQRVKAPFFFADFQILANGHIVVCNWMGHQREDSRKGPQLNEYDADGNLVWTWHDAEMAGCLHGIIVLDGLDTARLHTDLQGVLAPVP